jgi:glycosyltransferase involved in cell wall biosynthesis
MEWIVIDDGTDNVQDIFQDETKLPNLKYFATEKMNLGAKRNFMHTKAKGSIIVYMDDDDYYPPDRVEHAVERLQENPKAMCAGSSELYVYFKTLNRMVQFGPYGPNHSTAGTFAFRKTLLDTTQYDDNAALAEERAFLKDYTVPFVQLDPMKTILVFSHEHNTFDKRELLKNPESPVMRTSDKTVDMFILNDYEAPIKKFFMEDIDGLLDNYEYGLPKNKPEVIKQTKEIKEKREKMQAKITQEELNAHTGIFIDTENGEKKNLTKQEVVNILQDLQKKNKELTAALAAQTPITTKNSEGKEVRLSSSQIVNLISTLQQQVSQLTKEKEDLTNQISTTPRDDKKLENKIKDLEETIRRQENDNHTLSSKINTLKNTIETHKQDTPLIPKVSVSIDSEA